MSKTTEKPTVRLPKGYPVQQGYSVQQGIPAIQNQPYSAAYSQNYPQQYPQQYHPTQPGHKVVYQTSQSTPLMDDANGQQRQPQRQQRRRAKSESMVDCCDDFCEYTCCEDCCEGTKSLCVCCGIFGILIAIAIAVIFFADLFG